MARSVRIGVILLLVISGLCAGSDEFVRIERLSDRVVIGYWLGTGRMNIVAVKSQQGLAVIDTAMSPRIMAPVKERLEEGLKVDHVITCHSPVLTRNDLKYVRDYYQAMLDGIRAARREGLTLEQAKERFDVRKKFPRFYQTRSAEWSKAKQDRNITVLWQRLEEAQQKSQTLN
jgi:hypothetical protein